MRLTSCRVLALCALLVGSVAAADPPADAPTATPIRKGDPAPSDGVFLTSDRALDLARRCKAAQDRPPPGAAPVDDVAPAVVLGVVGLVLGALAGVWLAKHT